MTLFKSFFALFIQFLKNVWGSIQSPYATYRKIVAEDPYQLIIIFTLIAGYFFLASPLKLHTLHPFLLTVNASRLFTTVLCLYLGICFLLLGLSKLFNGVASLRSVLMAWGYSLIPTLVWFLVTLVMYVLIPPPRTETILGRGFSLLYLTFSLSLFFWKGLLYYLTLRFALKFDLTKIILASLLFFPLLGATSYFLYIFGIFKVPFI